MMVFKRGQRWLYKKGRGEKRKMEEIRRERGKR